jgi:tetratricopeptide (TPR) repeat protein
METWANSCAWNFQQKLFLLLAERDYSDGQLGSAEIYYHKAIERSIAHKFKNDEAFSYESVARFYLDTGDAQSAIAHFKLAHRSYSEWGASAKADKLFLFMENRFGHVWKNDAGNARSSRIYSVIDDSSRRGSKRVSNL